MLHGFVREKNYDLFLLLDYAIHYINIEIFFEHTSNKGLSKKSLSLLLILHKTSGVKRSLNFHLSLGQVKSNFYLSCCQLTCPKYIVK